MTSYVARGAFQYNEWGYDRKWYFVLYVEYNTCIVHTYFSPLPIQTAPPRPIHIICTNCTIHGSYQTEPMHLFIHKIYLPNWGSLSTESFLLLLFLLVLCHPPVKTMLLVSCFYVHIERKGGVAPLHHKTKVFVFSSLQVEKREREREISFIIGY